MKAAKRWSLQIENFEKVKNSAPLGTDGWAVRDIVSGRFVVAKLLYQPATNTLWCVERDTPLSSNKMTRGVTAWNRAELIYGTAGRPHPFDNLPAPSW